MSKSTTTTQKNEPPKWAKPLFEQSADSAMYLYKNKIGFNPYEGDRVADWSNAQRDSVYSMTNAADRARNMDYNVGGFGQLANRAGDGTYSERNLKDIASGQYLMGDKLFQEMLDDQSSKIADQANFSASAAGRYGSGMHTGVLADSVGDFRRDAILQNYAAERDRQLAANQMMDANRFQRLGMQGDFYGAQNAANQQKLDNINAGDRTAFEAGTLRQAQIQAEMDAERQAWLEQENENWTRLGALQAAAAGSAGPYGMMQTTQQQPFNPLGLLGTIGSLFMPSDSRLKTKIRRVGDDDRGFGVYEFAYMSDPDILYRGVMAQEVERVIPAAVVEIDGYKAVNYHALGLKMERV